MKHISIFLACALMGPLSAETVFTVAQGYTKITIAGASGVGEKKLTAISATLLQDVEFSGAATIGSFTADPDPENPDTQAVTVPGVTTWTAGQWTTEPHLAYLTVADDPGNADGIAPAEQAFLITANTTNGGLTLAAPSDLSPNFPASSTIKIRKANTLESIFQSGADNIDPEDRVFIWDSGIGNWQSFNYLFVSPGVGVWVGGGLPGPANDLVVNPQEGLFYSRAVVSDLVITLFGEVPAAPQLSSIEASGFMSCRVPIDTQVDKLGLQDSSWDPDNDRLYVWNLEGKPPGANGWDFYTFASTGPGTGIWLKGGAELGGSDVVKAGSAVFVSRNQPTATGAGQVVTELPYDPFAE